MRAARTMPARWVSCKWLEEGWVEQRLDNDDDDDVDNDDDDQAAPADKWMNGKLFHWDPFFGWTSGYH